MGEKLQLDEHGQVDRLLPWFVNDTLDARERERVQRHLHGCDACRTAASLLSRVQATVRHATATPMVPPPRTGRLLGSIDGFERQARRRRRMAAVGAAASLAGALLVVALLLPDREQASTAPARYETTTSPTQRPSIEYVLDLQFEAKTSMAAQAQILQKLQAREIDRRGSSGLYRVTVSLPAASLEELERYTSDLEASVEIESVNAVAVQIPVKSEVK